MGQLRDRSLHFTPEGIALIEEAMQGKDWDKNQLAEQVEISYESICRYLRGERPPQRKNIEIIAKRLGLKPIDLVNPDEWISSTKASETKTSLVDWRSVSKGMLDDLKRLTTEALTAGDGIRFDFDDIFVPLGVVERKERTKRKEDDGAPDRGSELYEEKVTPITHGEFFEDVLLRGNTKISNGKRIAVIGEAGAGKTTQLQKIGSWVLEESDDIPVWISLTDLGAKSLREYLFENWVREASGEIEAAPQAWKDSLGEAIKSGKVWLLLDGVDEMTVSDPLSYLSTQLKESWLKNVRVVLTCRVNVWDGGKNALTGFDVYRKLDFDYPDDVYKFIGKWFVRVPELAGSLTQALEQSGKERIRDMVKNPLRLTLLCYSWQLKQGELPETKAGLYEWFVEAFYKWNKGKTQIELSRSQEEKLNQALGELAKRAIDSETSRFRLTKTFIENVFREFDIDLFDLALKLNWLNEIGVAAEDPLETVYAFYHPSFQEYFAALAINDWNFFLPNRFQDPYIKNNYPIFDAQWKEIILIWLGRDSTSPSSKESFIKAMIEFEDGCHNIYFFRAYLLAAEGSAEFNPSNIDEILDQVISWIFGEFNEEAQQWYFSEFTQVQESSLATLRLMDSDLVTSHLCKLFNNEKIDFATRSLVLEQLGIIPSSKKSKEKAISILINFIEDKLEKMKDLEDKLKLKSKIFFRNGNKPVENEEIKSKRIDMQEEVRCIESYLGEAAKSLGKIAHGFEIAVKTLVELIEVSSTCEDVQVQAAWSLGKITIEATKEFSIQALEKLIVNPDSFFSRYEALESLIQIANNTGEDGKNLVILSLIGLMEKSKEDSVRQEVATYLKNLLFGEGSPSTNVPSKRVNNIQNTFENPFNLSESILLLKTPNTDQQEITEIFISLVANIRNLNAGDKRAIVCSVYENLTGTVCQDDYHRYYYTVHVLLECSKHMSFPEFYHACHECLKSTHPEIEDTSPSNNVEAIHNLNSQFFDRDKLQEELDRSNDFPDMRCIVVDIHPFTQEIDLTTLTKEIAIKIYNSLGCKIPEVYDTKDLKRELLNLQRILGVEKLAIALYGNSANEAINQLCQSLTESIQIRPFTGGQTTQELMAKINAWLSEM